MVEPVTINTQIPTTVFAQGPGTPHVRVTNNIAEQLETSCNSYNYTLQWQHNRIRNLQTSRDEEHQWQNQTGFPAEHVQRRIRPQKTGVGGGGTELVFLPMSIYKNWNYFNLF
jgi:hypothetical protein